MVLELQRYGDEWMLELHHAIAISSGDEYCNQAEIPAVAVTVAF